MKDRILQFLTSEKISPAEFADKIGVQRSSMSHILNGRNYPSASFIQKMLQAYPMVNSRWLMIGEGKMNIDMPDKEGISIAVPSVNSLNQVVQNTDTNSKSDIHSIPENETEAGRFSANVSTKDQFIPDQTGYAEEAKNSLPTDPVNRIDFQTLKDDDEASKRKQSSNQPPFFSAIQSGEKEIEQVLFFYKDKTFMAYRPS